jgi:hypothetical protein
MSSLPKVPIAQRPIRTNQASQKTAPQPSPFSPNKNPTVDFSREAPKENILVEGKDGHELTIHDNLGDHTQFYRYFVECKCHWQSRLQTFEQAKRAADNHVYQNTKPRLK